MGDTPICTIDDTGIHRPQFSDVLAYFTAGVKSIYGDDVYLGNDSMDGQMVGLLSSAVDDCNKQTVADYEAYSPSTAQGTGLSSVVKTNNIRRKVPTYSTVSLTIYGVWGTVINGGAVSDGENTWLLPAIVTVPFVGQIVVTATCAELGAVTIAPRAIDVAGGAGSITAGLVPGWQSAVNLSASAPGNPVETDPQLRQRQSLSTSISAQTTLQALHGALLAVDGVTYVRVYDNGGTSASDDGIPGQSIAVVVEGGDDGMIARIIALKKGICGTYGSTALVVQDVNGVSRTIRFFRPTLVPITVALTLKLIGSFTQPAQIALAAAQAAFTDALPYGEPVYRLQQLEGIKGVASGYKVEDVALARDGLPPASQDVSLAFYERPSCLPSYVSFPGLPALPTSP